MLWSDETICSLGIPLLIYLNLIPLICLQMLFNKKNFKTLKFHYTFPRNVFFIFENFNINKPYDVINYMY